MNANPQPPAAQGLVRGLGLLDATTLIVGSVIGSATDAPLSASSCAACTLQPRARQSGTRSWARIMAT